MSNIECTYLEKLQSQTAWGEKKVNKKTTIIVWADKIQRKLVWKRKWSIQMEQHTEYPCKQKDKCDIITANTLNIRKENGANDVSHRLWQNMTQTDHKIKKYIKYVKLVY